MNHPVYWGLGAALLCLSCASVSATDSDVAPDEDALRATLSSTRTIPVHEVSGLAWERGVQGSALLAVSDASSSLFQWDIKGGKLGVLRENPLSDARARAGFKSRTQWEAVASDASGRLFALEESPGRILVFDAAGRQLRHTITLSVEPVDAVGESWLADPNSRGEGLVLLRSGHVLVLKEKSPLALMEFGPSGDVALGMRAGDAVGRGDTFPLPAGDSSVMVPLKTWWLEKGDKLPDGSELAVGSAGELWVLSDQGECLAPADMPIRPTAPMLSFGKVVKLPPGIKKPEGLVLIGPREAWVVTDGKASKNLHLVSW